MFLKLLRKLQARRRRSDPTLIMNRNPAYGAFKIGEWSYGRPNIMRMDQTTQLEIGRFCSIADGVRILLGGEHRTDWVTTYPFPSILPERFSAEGHPASKGNIVIGNDVWICAGSTILSGVIIGNGAVVGAGCVAARDVPPYAVAAGNPARIVKMRFSDEQISALLAIRWWTWDDERILQSAALLLSENVSEFIRQSGHKRSEEHTSELQSQ